MAQRGPERRRSPRLLTRCSRVPYCSPLLHYGDERRSSGYRDPGVTGVYGVKLQDPMYTLAC